MQYDDESLHKYGEQSDKLCQTLKLAVDRIQRLSEALTQEQVRGVEREEAMRHLQDSLSDEQRRLNNVRDALDKEMQLTKQLEEKLSFEKSNVSLLGMETSHQEKKEIRQKVCSK